MATFYSSGGIWMHPITLCGLVATAALVWHATHHDQAFFFSIWGALLLAVLFGLLGFFAGWIESFSALALAVKNSFPNAQHLLYECMSIVFNPLAWAFCWVTLVGLVALPVMWWRSAKSKPAH